MTSFVETHNNRHSKPATRILANFMIFVGVIALPFVLYKEISDVNIYNSPFDVVEGINDGEKGFLPLILNRDEEEELTQAPTLSAQELDVVNQEKIEEVMDVIQPADAVSLGRLEEQEVLIPDRIVIPSLNLDTRILLADFKEIPFWGEVYKQWLAPNSKAVGWHYDSATLGRLGNTVLNGHHNVYGEVFRYLGEVNPGSIIYLYSGDRVFSYIVVLVEILPEKYQSIDQRLENAQWTLPSEDERITLISCWPYESNTDRVVVVAAPIDLNGAAP